ncbi:MAG: hypothetical protein WAV00_04785 [Nocardioides sp.]
MTLQEIFQRIIRAHWVAISICTLLPVLLVLGLETRNTTEWTGSVRIQVVSAAPVSTTEADAVSSRVLALATTPTLVQKALSEAGMNDDPAKVAQHQVSATRLGESPVVDVTVTASSPDHAKKLSAALVQQVVQFMNDGSRPALDQELASLGSSISKANQQRGDLTDRLASTASLTQREVLNVRIRALDEQISQLAAQRSALLQTKLSIDQAVVIDGDNPQVTQVPSGLLPRMALALVLGLVIGLALAVLLETLAPRLAGIRALARTLAAPVLGRTDQKPSELAATMTLTARRQGVETVVLLGVDSRDSSVANALVSRLPKPGAADAPSNPGAKAPAKPPLGRPRNGPRQQQQQVSDPFTVTEIAFSSLDGLTPEAERTAGVVVVSSGSCHVRDVDNLQDRLTALRWPVIGIVQVTSSLSKGAS